MPTAFSSQTQYAVAGSTYEFTVSYTDPDDSPVTPDTMAWSLVDASGTTINSRSSVSITSLSTSNDILLGGNDLPTGSALQWIYCILSGTFTYKGSPESTRDWVAIPVKDTGL